MNDMCSDEHLQLLILELLLFRGFFAHFDHAGLHQHSRADDYIPSVDFVSYELVIPGRKTIPSVDSFSSMSW
jgi:hypothetical protein